MKLYLLLALFVLSGATSAAAQTDGSKAKEVQTHEQRAHELLSEKKPELAAKEFAAVLSIDPHNLDAQANLGVLLFFQSDYAGAEPHLRAAVQGGRVLLQHLQHTLAHLPQLHLPTSQHMCKEGSMGQS